MKQAITKTAKRIRRHQRVRSQVIGTAQRPRLAVFRSNRFLSAQIIDDSKGHTLAAISDRDMKGEGKRGRAETAGKALAEAAKKLNITQVVFDRGGFLYAGRVKSFAEGARSGGLEF